MTNDNFPDQVSEDMYYSQDSSCTERSKSDADDIIDEPQNLIFNGKNDTPISEAIDYSPADPSSFQVTTTQRGGVCLMEGNFVYTIHRTMHNKVHCSAYRGLFARQEFIPVVTHEANSDAFHSSKLKAGMKRSASLAQVGTHTILTNSISELDQGSAVKLPKLNSLKQTVHRARKRAANVPPEPNSLIVSSYHLIIVKQIKDNASFFTIQE